MILQKIIKLALVILCLTGTQQLAQAQINYVTADSSYARSALGFGLALNTSTRDATILGIGGFGVNFHGQVRLSNRFALIPSVGAEVPHGAIIGMEGRYFVQPAFYVQAGGFLQIAGDGLDDSGLRPTAGIGFLAYTNKNQFFDFNFHADHLNIEGKNDFLVGLRVTYNFCLSKGPSQGDRHRHFPPRPKLPF